MTASASTSTSVSPAARIGATLASVFFPGAGHVYVGRPVRGLLWCVVLLIIVASSPWTRMAGVVALPLGLLATAIDAWRVSRRPVSMLRPLAQRLGLTVAVAMSMWGARFAVRTWYLEGFFIPSAGMAPTVLPGEHLFALKFRTHPDRGDVIVFRHPREQQQTMIMRVVARGGDTVEVRAGSLILNGKDVTQGSAERCAFEGGRGDPRCTTEALGNKRFVVAREGGHNGDFPATDQPPFVVPANHVFVLGDNRDDSADSRQWGPVPLDHVIGTASFVWMSKGASSIRWARLGTEIN